MAIQSICAIGLGVGLIVLSGTEGKSAGDSSGLPSAARAFHTNVSVTVSGDVMIVHSDGIPTHPTGTFPNPTNPNRIQKQNYEFKIPLAPRRADKVTPLPFGPVGVALNGIPFYNPYNAQGRDAVLGPYAEIFDSCCGHPDPMGRYHYHKYPVCVKSPFTDEPGKHSPLIGYAFDGFALYGPNGVDGKPPGDLDDCNGHSDKERGYHYHVTVKFPYLLGGYRGVVNMDNFRRGPNPWGRGEPGDRRGPPPPRGRPPPPPPEQVN
jgi:hypothetical protein